MRWPFAVALAATVVGTGALAATPYVEAAWEERQYAALEREAAAEFERAQPAADALEAMTRPAGLANCPGVAAGGIAVAHVLCWEGEGEVEPATVAVATELRRIGAEQLAPRCRRKATGHPGLRVHCAVTASLRGQAVSITLLPRVEKVGTTYRSLGVFVSGDVGVWEVEELSSLNDTATPLPLPA